MARMGWSREGLRCVLCALSGFAAPGCRCCLAPVCVPWLWPAACLSGVPRGPAWCAAPRPVRSLLVLRSAFLTQWCPSPPWGLAPPALLGGCAGHAEAGRERGSLCLPLAPAEAGALGSLRVVPVWGPAMGLSLAGPSGVGLGLRALRLLACVDPVTDASGFPYRPLCDGELGRCTGAVSCGRRHLPLRVGGRHTRVPCVCACTRSSWPGRACRPPGRIFVRLTFPPAALSFCLARPPPGWGCPFLVPLFAFLRLSLFPLRASVVSFFLWFPAPGALGLGALFSFPLSPSCVVFLFFLRPCFLWLSLLCGPGCPEPWRCVLFVLLVPGFSAVRALSLPFCFPPGRRLLPGGCCPPLPLCLAVFVAAARCPPLFFLLCSALACFLGARRRFLPAAAPPPLLLFVLLVSRLTVLRALSVLLCFPPGRWLLPCGCCPLPLMCLAVFVAAARCPPPFFSFLCCSALACFSGAHRRFSPAAAPPPLLLFVLLVSRCSALRALSVLLCFPPGRWLLPCGCCPPLPLCLAVFVAAARCPPLFFLCCSALACFLGARRRFSPAAAPPPPPPLLLLVLLVPRCSALCALSLLLCFPPGRLLLPCGCCPTPPLMSRGFCRCRSVPPPLFFLCCSALACFLGALRRLSPAAAPRPLLLFVLLVARCSALRALSVLLCLQPGRWLLPCGCCPPPTFVSRDFRRCRSVPPPFFFSAALLLPAHLALVGGSRLLLPPPPSSCLCCWSPAALLSVSSRCFCVSRLAVRCSLVVAAPPSLCVSRFLSLPLGAPPFFFSAALLLPAFLALVAGSRRLLPPPPPSSCLFCWSPAARLSVRSRCFFVFCLTFGCSLVFAPPPPLLCLAVFVAAARCSVFFLLLLLCSCLALVGGCRRLLPPLCGACVVPCAVCGPLCCLVLPRCAVLRSGVVRCRVTMFCAACHVVVPRLAVFWAASRRAVVVGASVCVLCCAVGGCCVLCPVSGRAVRLGCSRCGLSRFGLPCCVLCCAVCPWVPCCAALLRVVPPGVVLLCPVLFFLRSFGVAACCAVPSGAARRPRALRCAALRFAVFPRAVCSLRCVFCRGVLVRAVVRRCALCCVCPGVLYCAFPVLFALCGAVLRCAGALALRGSCGACRCWRLALWCAAVCCAVSFGVLWCGAGSGGPSLFAGGVYWCRCPCLAAWSASLWLVRFAVVPCFPVSCSMVLCCRVVLCCRALLLFCGAVCACFALLWPVVRRRAVLCYAVGYLCCSLPGGGVCVLWCPFPPCRHAQKTLIFALCYPAPISVSGVYVVEEAGLVVRRFVVDPGSIVFDAVALFVVSCVDGVVSSWVRLNLACLQQTEGKDGEGGVESGGGGTW